MYTTMSEEQSQFEQYLSTKTSDLLDELSTLLAQYDNGKEMPIDVKVHLAMFNLGSMTMSMMRMKSLIISVSMD